MADFPFYNFLDKMFADMEAEGIKTLVVDVHFLMAIHSTKDIFYSLKSLGFAPKFVWT